MKNITLFSAQNGMDESGFSFKLLGKYSLNNFEGISISFFNRFKHFEGIVIGKFNVIEHLEGIAFGFYNNIKHLEGVSFGVINKSQQVDGLHLGIFNIKKHKLNIPLVSSLITMMRKAQN